MPRGVKRIRPIDKGVEEIQKQLKSVNQKVRRLAKKYGTDNIEYQRYISDMERNFAVHYTKEGAIQINKPKLGTVDGKITGMSAYQYSILNKLSKRKGVKALEAAAKERLIKGLEKQGIKKPKVSKSEVEREVIRQSERQNAIDETLDMIYMEESEGTIPSDLADIYNRMHRHGKGAGMGVSNADIDKLIDGMQLWSSVKQQIEDVSTELENLGAVSSDMGIEIWGAMSSQNTLAENEELLQRLQDELDLYLAEPEL